MCNYVDCTIPVLDEHLMTGKVPHQAIILSSRRRICAQVGQPRLSEIVRFPQGNMYQGPILRKREA